jgi:hypothetical protein
MGIFKEDGMARKRGRQIFVSYSRHDADIVSPFCELLRVTGVPVFRDRDSIQAGKRWKVVITDSLQDADCVLVFWSTNSAKSPAVKDEYDAAIRMDKDIAPVLLDDTPLVEGLRHFQWIDCRPFIIVKAPDSAAKTVGSVIGGIVGFFFGGPPGAAIAGPSLGAGLGSDEPATIIRFQDWSGNSRSRIAVLFGQRFCGDGRPDA